MVVDLGSVPNLAEIFARLRRGYHVSADDGPLYLALRGNSEALRTLFGALGLALAEHQRGFYYLESEADVGKEAMQFCVFFLILVEAWGDEGRDIEHTAFSPGGHEIARLPHYSRESWRQCMLAADAGEPSQLTDIIRNLERHGFVLRLTEERFRMKAPAWRFLDLCSEARTIAPGTTEGPTP